jgi:hypothetical protein
MGNADIWYTQIPSEEVKWHKNLREISGYDIKQVCMFAQDFDDCGNIGRELKNSSHRHQTEAE